MTEVNHVIDKYILKRQGLDVDNLVRAEQVLYDIIVKEILAICVWGQVNLKCLPFSGEDILDDIGTLYAQVILNDSRDVPDTEINTEDIRYRARENLDDVIEKISDILSFDNYSWVDINGYEALEVCMRKDILLIACIGDTRIFKYHDAEHTSKFIESILDEKSYYTRRYE
jgi:hypothetical protein